MAVLYSRNSKRENYTAFSFLTPDEFICIVISDIEQIKLHGSTYKLTNYLVKQGEVRKDISSYFHDFLSYLYQVLDWQGLRALDVFKNIAG